ncbi:MAG: hypothetical protein KDK26_18705 [Roseivivax sp.]|nr:hypothetical protein [Roseivivax sp.]
MGGDLRLWLATLMAFASGAAVAWVAFLLFGAYLYDEATTNAGVAQWMLAGAALGFPFFATVGLSLTGRRARAVWWLKGVVVSVLAAGTVAGLVTSGSVPLAGALGIVGLPLFLLAGYSLGQQELRA